MFQNNFYQLVRKKKKKTCSAVHGNEQACPIAVRASLAFPPHLTSPTLSTRPSKTTRADVLENCPLWPIKATMCSFICITCRWERRNATLTDCLFKCIIGRSCLEDDAPCKAFLALTLTWLANDDTLLKKKYKGTVLINASPFHLLSVTFAKIKADETASHAWLLPDWTGWHPGSANDLELHCDDLEFPLFVKQCVKVLLSNYYGKLWLEDQLQSTLTWKLVSFQPGFFANILTRAWQGIEVTSIVSTAYRHKYKNISATVHGTFSSVFKSFRLEKKKVFWYNWVI